MNSRPLWISDILQVKDKVKEEAHHLCSCDACIECNGNQNCCSATSRTSFLNECTIRWNSARSISKTQSSNAKKLHNLIARSHQRHTENTDLSVRKAGKYHKFATFALMSLQQLWFRTWHRDYASCLWLYSLLLIVVIRLSCIWLVFDDIKVWHSNHWHRKWIKVLRNRCCITICKLGRTWF